MDPIKIQNMLAIAGVITVGLFYLIVPYRTCKIKKYTLNGYLLIDQKVTGEQFANTFAVTNIALAGNIAFFIECHREYGYLMGLGPLFFPIIQLIMLSIFKKKNINFLKVRTIGDLWGLMFPGKIIPRFFAILCALNCIMVVFSEVLAASDLLSIFLPANSIYKVIIFFGLLLVCIGYVSYGGYKAVIATDGWQFVGTLIAIFIMIYFSINIPTLNNSTSADIARELFSYKAQGWPLLSFIIWAISINIAGAVIDIPLWHRMASSNSIKEAFFGFIKGLWKWIVIFMLPMMCFILIYLKGNHYNNISGFFSIIQMQSGVLGYIILPAIVLGFIIAALSTTDTYLIAAMYSLCDNNTLLPALAKNTDKKTQAMIKKYIIIFMGVLLCIMGLFYYIRNNTITDVITPVMYIIWGQISMLSPLVIYSLYRYIKNKPVYNLSKLQNYIIIGSWFTGLLLTVYISSLCNNLYSQLMFFASIGIVIFGMIVSFNLTYLSNLKRLFFPANSSYTYN